MIKKVLKERLPLRAICRVFGVGINWPQSFSHVFWERMPSGLGLPPKLAGRIKKLQVFGVQADGLWLFVQKRANERWVWAAYGPVHRLAVAYHIGGRGKKAAKKFWGKVPPALHSCSFETDGRGAYQSITPPAQHKVGKDLAFYIEGFNTTIGAKVSRLVRKSLSFSKLDKWHDTAIGWFSWQFSLERQHYI